MSSSLPSRLLDHKNHKGEADEIQGNPRNNSDDGSGSTVSGTEKLRSVTFSETVTVNGAQIPQETIVWNGKELVHQWKFADPVSDDRRPELLAQLKAEYISADLASRPQLFHCSRAADPTYPDRWKSSVGWPVVTARRASGLRGFGRFWTSWSGRTRASSHECLRQGSRTPSNCRS
jgi:hypothetical protein